MIAEYEADEIDPLLTAPRQYGISQNHKHLPEMTAITGLENSPVFSPIVSSFYAGMEVTVPLFKKQILGTAEDIKKIYKSTNDYCHRADLMQCVRILRCKRRQLSYR